MGHYIPIWCSVCGETEVDDGSIGCPTCDDRRLRDLQSEVARLRKALSYIRDDASYHMECRLVAHAALVGDPPTPAERRALEEA